MLAMQIVRLVRSETVLVTMLIGVCVDEEQVREVVEANKPDLLVSLECICDWNCISLILYQFTASMWTPEQSQKIQAEAKSIVPGLKTFALPQGLQVEKGPDAVVDFIIENLPALLEG